jgi:hypothetical protein
MSQGVMTGLTDLGCALTLKEAEIGFPIRRVGAMATDAGGSIAGPCLPFGQERMKMTFKIALAKHVGMALQTIGIGNGVRQGRRLLRRLSYKSHQVNCADFHCIRPPRDANPRMTVDATRLLSMMVRGQIHRRCGLAASKESGFGLGMTRRAKGIILFEVGRGQQCSTAQNDNE